MTLSFQRWRVSRSRSRCGVAERTRFGDDGDAVPPSAAHDGARDARHDPALDLQAGRAERVAEAAKGFAAGDDQGAGRVELRGSGRCISPRDMIGGDGAGCAGGMDETRQGDARCCRARW